MASFFTLLFFKTRPNPIFFYRITELISVLSNKQTSALVIIVIDFERIANYVLKDTFNVLISL